MQGPKGLVELVAREAVGVGVQGMEGNGKADHHHQHEHRETDEVEEHRPDYLMAETFYGICCRNQTGGKGGGAGRKEGSTIFIGARDKSDPKTGTMLRGRRIQQSINIFLLRKKGMHNM